MNTIIDEIKSLLISSYKGEERIKGLVTKDFLSSNELKKVTYNAFKVIYPLKFEGKAFDLSDQEFDNKYEYALRLVRLTYLTTIETSSSLTENQDQETWLTEKRIETIGWEEETHQTYRRRYIKYLTAIRPASVVNETKESSLSILRKIGDPHSKHEFFVKGLVVGSVQSGKTSNFNAVINSCIDAGYQLIIVLSGLMEDLRQQTQIRIEKEVQGKMLTQGDFIGVGKIASFGQQGHFPNVKQIVVPTSLENDFGLNMQQAAKCGHIEPRKTG